MQQHEGSCHCGTVKFKIRGKITELTTCDCSICIKKNAVMTKIHEDDFELMSKWADLTQYNWNMKVARHFFCKKCGIYTFHKKRAQPDYFGINVFCLDGFDSSSINVRATEGQNMTVKSSNARPQWLGPRVPSN